MTPMADHAKPPLPHKDRLLWVLYLIGALCLLEVCPAWTGIGAIAGYPHIKEMPTDWVLPVIIEAYWGLAAYAWLHDSAGDKSRRFAFASAAAVFVMSVAGQVSAHLLFASHRAVSPPALTGFAAALPVLILGCAAILIHLRHADRATAEAAATAAEHARIKAQAAERAADERTALRAEADALRESLETARAGHDERLGAVAAELETAQRDLAAAEAKAVTLARKLDAATGRKPARKSGTATGRKSPPATGRKPESATAPATAPEDGADETANLDTEALILKYMDEGLSASAAGIKAGLTDSRGRQIAREAARRLAAAPPAGHDPADRS